MKRLHTVFVISACSFLLFSCTSTSVETASAPVSEPQTAAPTPVKESSGDEYAKAISGISGNYSISKDTFEDDRSTILAIIDELSVIMDKQNYKKWCTYIEPQSLEYWKKPAHLAKASSRLPVKGISLKNLEDYFHYVFIPSRKGHDVSQIRYISDESVKAVQVAEDESVVVYYNFIKVNNIWMVQLPEIN